MKQALSSTSASESKASPSSLLEMDTPQSVDRAMVDLDTIVASLASLRTDIRTNASNVRAENLRLANEAAEAICRVCLEPMGVLTRIQLQCGHRFCSTCSDQWSAFFMARSGSDDSIAPCPLCRSTTGRANAVEGRVSSPQACDAEGVTGQGVTDEGVTVLSEDIDDDYEPSEAEVTVYFAWLGMVSPDHDDLRWMCRAALKEPLPEGWKACRTSDGEVFYYNFNSGESVWDHPVDTRYRKLFEEEKCKRARGRAAKTLGVSSSRQSTSREAVEAYRAFQQSLASRS